MTPPNGEVSHRIGLVKISIEYSLANVHGGGGADRTGHILGELVTVCDAAPPRLFIRRSLIVCDDWKRFESMRNAERKVEMEISARTCRVTV